MKLNWEPHRCVYGMENDKNKINTGSGQNSFVYIEQFLWNE